MIISRSSSSSSCFVVVVVGGVAVVVEVAVAVAVALAVVAAAEVVVDVHVHVLVHVPSHGPWAQHCTPARQHSPTILKVRIDVAIAIWRMMESFGSLRDFVDWKCGGEPPVERQVYLQFHWVWLLRSSLNFYRFWVFKTARFGTRSPCKGQSCFHFVMRDV